MADILPSLCMPIFSNQPQVKLRKINPRPTLMALLRKIGSGPMLMPIRITAIVIPNGQYPIISAYRP